MVISPSRSIAPSLPKTPYIAQHQVMIINGTFAHPCHRYSHVRRYAHHIWIEEEQEREVEGATLAAARSHLSPIESLGSARDVRV